MIRALAQACSLLPGAAELVRLAWATRFRLRGKYWSWRMETAFGRGMPQSKRELVVRALEYGRWARRMRRLSARTVGGGSPGSGTRR